MANQPSAEELKKKLSEMQFYVTQDRGTEPPFTGRLLHNKTRWGLSLPGL